jgi:hypothetical protein
MAMMASRVRRTGDSSPKEGSGLAHNQVNAILFFPGFSSTVTRATWLAPQFLATPVLTLAKLTITGLRSNFEMAEGQPNLTHPELHSLAVEPFLAMMRFEQRGTYGSRTAR